MLQIMEVIWCWGLFFNRDCRSPILISDFRMQNALNHTSGASVFMIYCIYRFYYVNTGVITGPFTDPNKVSKVGEIKFY